ncbi:MAG: HD domain-containing protein [Bradymonadaceae bacterium]
MTRLGDALDGEPPFPGLAAYEWGPEAARVVAEAMATDGAHDAGHLGRVFASARTIAAGERDAGREIDWEVVVAAVLFHDVVNLPKDAPDRASASARSAERARLFFDGRGGFDEGQMALLGEAIERHSFSQDRVPESLEARIVCDADRLEAIGAVGIARTFYVSGTMEGQIAHPSDPFADERALDDTSYAVDHFFEKLLALKDEFLTATGREMAERRHEVLVEFLEEFGEEVGATATAKKAYGVDPRGVDS